MCIQDELTQTAFETPHQRNERRGINAEDWPCRKLTTQELLDRIDGEHEVKREIAHRLSMLIQILETTPEDVLGRSVWDWV